MQFDFANILGICKAAYMERGSDICLDLFKSEVMDDYLNSTFYTKNFTLDHIDIPVLFGDDKTFTDAKFCFAFFE